VVHWPSGADEHQAHDRLVPVCVGDGLVVVCTGLGDVVAGTGFGLVVLGLEDALFTALGNEPGDGFGDDAGPGCAAQWNGIELAGHFGAAAADTRVSLPDARQAVRVTCWPDTAVRPGCAAQWNGIELAGHFGAVAADTRVSLPDARQAVRVTCWPAAPAVLARFAASGERLSASLVAWLPASA
jgi:hypothetical protein